MDKPVMTIGDPDNVNVSHLLMAGARSFHANTVAEAILIERCPEYADDGR